jgi:branched-subunit amino acid ABC-type transport system permease component
MVGAGTMSDFLPFVVSGLAAGALFGLMGTGLVLTYKTSGLFNFGHGAIAAIAAYIFYWLNQQKGVDWKLSAVVSVLVVGTLLGLLMEQISRRLSRQSTAVKVVGTVGLILVVDAAALILFGNRPRTTKAFLPGSSGKLEIFGAFVTYDQLLIVAISVVAVAILYAVFRWTRAGVEMRAVVDDADLLAIQGREPARTRRVAWILGANLAALSGVLIAPIVGLNAIVLTFLVVQAFGAAAVGYMSSIPLTFLGGLLIGVIADVSKRYVLDFGWLQGLPSALPFIFLLFFLLVLPKRLLLPPSSTAPPRERVHYAAPPRVRVVTGIVVLAALVAVPSVVGTKVPFFTVGLATGLIVLSLGLLVRTSGQVSLAHATFAAVGAVAFSQLAVDHGLPWFLALLLASLVTVPVGVLVALPAIRLSGLYVALATFGFGVLVQRLFYREWIMFSPFAEARPMPRPSFATTDARFYYVALAILVAASLLVVTIHHARLGRLLRALSDSPTAITAMGLSTNTTKVVVFAISAFLGLC